MKKKILKNWKRIAAVMLAAVMVVGSVNLSDIVVNAAEDDSPNPYYDSVTGKYIYNGYDVINSKTGYYSNVIDEDSGNFVENPYDVFGAATHVHLFARDSIESDVHTHGNIFCQTADLGEVGTRVQNNDLINKIPGYREESYISNTVKAINGSSDFDTLILGSSIGLRLEDNGHRRAVQIGTSQNYMKLDNTDPRYIFQNSGSAINFTHEFEYLEYLSGKWADMDDSSNVSRSGRKITIDGWDGTTNLYYTMSYAEWHGTPIEITGMNGNQDNKGILVINIDMKDANGATDISLTGNGTVVQVGGKDFISTEYKTTQYGQCRIVYNIVNDKQPYEGNLKFGNTVLGSILAPKANITVADVNGTVMANSINHTGGESHRMDIWALTENGTHVPPTKPNMSGEEGTTLAEKDIENSFGPVMDETNPVITRKPGVDIRIHKTYDSGLPSDLNVSGTVFALYKTEADAGAKNGNFITTASAKRISDNDQYAEVVISLTYDQLKNLCGNSEKGEITLYITETKSSTGYTVNDTIYQYIISFTKNSSGNSFIVDECTYVGTTNKYFECDNQKTPSDDEDKGGEDEGNTTTDTPDEPNTSDESNKTDEPSTSNSTSSTSSKPSTSSTPSTPSTPTTPSTPSTPSTPTTPSTPSTPSTPNTWETPDGKVRYEILIEYEHIDSSSTPERIEELTKNTTIKITDKDGNDVTENVTEITWDPSRNVAIVTVEAPKPSEGFDTYYVVEDTDPADNDLSHSEPGKGFTVAITSDGKVLFQEDGSATPTTELRFVNVETATDIIDDDSPNSMTSMTSAQTGERKLPWAVFGGGMSIIFIAGAVYVFRKKENIK